jgi:transketolase N-terminal domain/subunit
MMKLGAEEKLKFKETLDDLKSIVDRDALNYIFVVASGGSQENGDEYEQVIQLSMAHRKSLAEMISVIDINRAEAKAQLDFHLKERKSK